MTHSDENKVDGIVLVSEDAQQYLNPRQEVTYREHRRELAEWMLALGKNPDKAEGYSHSTAKNRMNRLDLFYRFIWNRKGRYVQDLTTDHADTWMQHLARQDMKESTKNHYQKAAYTLFKWKRNARNKDTEWEPHIEYSDPSTTYTPRDYLTREDRKKLREAAMSYGSVPHYNSVTPEERDRWKTHLAQRLQKPKDEVTMKDWNKEGATQYIDAITRMNQTQTAEQLDVSRDTINRYKNALHEMNAQERLLLIASLTQDTLLQQTTKER